VEKLLLEHLKAKGYLAVDQGERRRVLTEIPNGVVVKDRRRK
jgi:hypothetical protein